MPLLEFDKVSKRYDMRGRGRIWAAAHSETRHDAADTAGQGIEALTEISLSVSPGDSIGIIGESGSGKTTLAALATGLVRPSSGRVLVDGVELSGTGKSRRRNARNIQLVWQDTGGSVDPRMNVGRILEEPLRVHDLCGRNEIRKRVGSLLQEAGLSGKLIDRYPHELSGGELQRVVIARALALNPRLLICDEPAASLDMHAKLQVADLLTRLQSERNLALIVIAHDLSLVGMITRELVVMKRGVIVERGSTETLIKRPSHPYTRLLVGCDPSSGLGLPALAVSAAAED
ncbi:MAG: ABC transporter ATP-binding protein [Thermoleophilia bacterium]